MIPESFYSYLYKHERRVDALDQPMQVPDDITFVSGLRGSGVTTVALGLANAYDGVVIDSRAVVAACAATHIWPDPATQAPAEFVLRLLIDETHRQRSTRGGNVPMFWAHFPRSVNDALVFARAAGAQQTHAVPWLFLDAPVSLCAERLLLKHLDDPGAAARVEAGAVHAVYHREHLEFAARTLGMDMVVIAASAGEGAVLRATKQALDSRLQAAARRPQKAGHIEDAALEGVVQDLL
jgi:hypothetical protein